MLAGRNSTFDYNSQWYFLRSVEGHIAIIQNYGTTYCVHEESTTYPLLLTSKHAGIRITCIGMPQFHNLWLADGSPELWLADWWPKGVVIGWWPGAKRSLCGVGSRYYRARETEGVSSGRGTSPKRVSFTLNIWQLRESCYCSNRCYKSEENISSKRVLTAR